jgi:hypothetical protein
MRGQLEAVEKTAQSQALFDVVKWLSEDDSRRARKILIQLQTKRYGDWTSEEAAAARKVCVMFDIVEILIRNRVIPPGVIETHWGGTICDCRDAATELIEQTRLSLRQDAWRYFDDLRERSLGQHH